VWQLSERPGAHGSVYSVPHFQQCRVIAIVRILIATGPVFQQRFLTVNIVVLDGYTLNPGDLSWGDLESIGEIFIYDRSSQLRFYRAP